MYSGILGNCKRVEGWFFGEKNGEMIQDTGMKRTLILNQASTWDSRLGGRRDVKHLHISSSSSARKHTLLCSYQESTSLCWTGTFTLMLAFASLQEPYFNEKRRNGHRYVKWQQRHKALWQKERVQYFNLATLGSLFLRRENLCN